MSYLMLPDGVPDFKKAVISFWFRIPKRSMDKALAAYTGEEGKILDGIIPLVVMGTKGTDNAPTKETKERMLARIDVGVIPTSPREDTTTNAVIGGCPQHGFINIGGVILPTSFLCTVTKTYKPATFGPGAPHETYDEESVWSTSGPGKAKNPTCIGVDVTGGRPTLYVNFETSKKAAVSSYWFNRRVTPGTMETDTREQDIGLEGTYTMTGCSIPFGLALPFYDIVEEDNTSHVYAALGGSSTGDPIPSYTDVSDVFINGTAAITAGLTIDVTPNKWHHVLVSVELKTMKTHGDPDGFNQPIAQYVDSASRLFIALDDKNYTKMDLSSNWPIGSSDDNAIISDDAWTLAGENNRNQDNPGPVASYVLDNPTVPSNGKPLGFPGTKEVVDNIYQVELAEFLMFVDYEGATFDTSKEENRRLFITKKDKNGKQYPTNPTPVTIPVLKEAIGDPAKWEPGADWPAYVPPRLNTTIIPSAIPIPAGSKKAIMADVDFTKCSLNWITGLNLGTATGKGKAPVEGKGKIRAYSPDPVLEG